MSQPWFNAETGTLLLDEYVVQRPSFRKVMEDSVVTDEEVTEQAHRVLSLFFPEAGGDAHAGGPLGGHRGGLGELAVLYALERYHQFSAR